MRIFILSLLLIFPLTSFGQSEFVCDVKKITKEIARSGAWLSFSTSSKMPAHKIENISDSTVLILDTLGRALIKDTLVFFGTKIIGKRVLAKNIHGYWAILDSDFKQITAFEYEDLSFELIKPRLTTQVKKNGKWGFIDSLNNLILPLEYDKSMMLTRSVAFVVKNEKKYLFFLREQSLVPLDDKCVQIPEGLYESDYCYFKENGFVGVMNSNGEVIIKPDYESIKYVDQTYLKNAPDADLFIVSKKGRFGIKSIDGTIDVPILYRRIYPFRNVLKLEIDNIGYYRIFNGQKLTDQFFIGTSTLMIDDSTAIVQENGKKGILNLADFSYAVKPIYQDLKSFRGGLIHAKNNGKYGMINVEGKELVECKYDEEVSRTRISQDNRNYLIKIKQDGMYGYLDEADNFKEVLKPSYHLVQAFSGGRARVMKNNKWGFLDESYKEVIALKYDFVVPFKNNQAKVIDNGKVYYINPNGDCVKGCDK